MNLTDEAVRAAAPPNTDTRRTTVSHRHVPHAEQGKQMDNHDEHGPDTDESAKERRDRELLELLNGLRVIIPGVQVLFAFLLAVPFAGFAEADPFQRGILFVTTICGGGLNRFADDLDSLGGPGWRPFPARSGPPPGGSGHVVTTAADTPRCFDGEREPGEATGRPWPRTFRRSGPRRSNAPVSAQH